MLALLWGAAIPAESARLVTVPATVRALPPAVRAFAALDQAIRLGVSAPSGSLALGPAIPDLQVRVAAAAAVPGISAENQPKLAELLRLAPAAGLATPAVPRGPGDTPRDGARGERPRAARAPGKKGVNDAAPAGSARGAEREAQRDALSVLRVADRELSRVRAGELGRPGAVEAVLNRMWEGMRGSAGPEVVATSRERPAPRTADFSRPGKSRPEPKSKRPALARALLAYGGELAETAGELIDSLARGRDPDPFVASLRARGRGILGEGDEAVAVELAPTRELLRDPAFREGLRTRLAEDAVLRRRLLEDLPPSRREELPEGGFDADIPEPRLLDFLLSRLPSALVAKAVRPDRGAWDPQWGRRSFGGAGLKDAPAYAVVELGDGLFLALQPRVEPSELPLTAWSESLAEGWEVLDRTGTGQAGTGADGNEYLIDYGAIGRRGEDDTMKALTDPAAAARAFDEGDDEDAALDLELAGLVGVDPGARARQRRAVVGAGEFAGLPARRREALKLLFEEAGEELRVDPDGLSSAIQLFAFERGEFPDLTRARAEVESARRWAVERGLLAGP